MDGDQPQVVDQSGERGRNRTFNLLIKSYSSRFACSVINCGHHNNLTIKRPAWTASEKRWKSGGACLPSVICKLSQIRFPSQPFR